MAIQEFFPYLHVSEAAKAIEFYVAAFDAREKFRLVEPSGRIGHAELDFAGTTVMLADEFLEFGIRGPRSIGGTSVSLHIHVDDADAAIRKAEEAGATVTMEAKDQFYGERSGCVLDPFGHRWTIGHHIEEVAEDEMQRRYTALFEE